MAIREKEKLPMLTLFVKGLKLGGVLLLISSSSLSALCHTLCSDIHRCVGVLCARAVLRVEQFDGVEASRGTENWLIGNHGFQPQCAASELTKKKKKLLEDV